MTVVFFLKKYFGTKWNYLELLISKLLISEKNCSREMNLQRRAECVKGVNYIISASVLVYVVRIPLGIIPEISVQTVDFAQLFSQLISDNNTVLIVCSIYGVKYSLYYENTVRQEIRRPKGTRCACATSL